MLTFTLHGHHIEVWRALRGQQPYPFVGLCRSGAEGDRVSLWIDPDEPVGTPRFVAILVHEAVHAAGCILARQGRSLDPRDEELPNLVDKIVETALTRIGEAERDALL